MGKLPMGEEHTVRTLGQKCMKSILMSELDVVDMGIYQLYQEH